MIWRWRYQDGFAALLADFLPDAPFPVTGLENGSRFLNGEAQFFLQMPQLSLFISVDAAVFQNVIDQLLVLASP